MKSLLTLARASGEEEREATAVEAEVMSLDAGRRASWLEARLRISGGAGVAGRQPDAATVEAGSEAQRAAEAIDARAFTVGGRVYLGDEYAPGTREGDGLLAHELTHARQQQVGPPRLAASPKRPTAKQVKTFCAASWIQCGKSRKNRPRRIVSVRRSDKAPAPTVPTLGLSPGKATVLVEVPKDFSSKYVTVYLVNQDGTPIRGGSGVLWAGSSEKEQEVEVDRTAAEAVGSDTRAMVVEENVDYYGESRFTGLFVRVTEVAKVGSTVHARLDVGDAEGASGTFRARLTFGSRANRFEFTAFYLGGGGAYRDFVIDDPKAKNVIGNLQEAVSKGTAIGTLLVEEHKDK